MARTYERAALQKVLALLKPAVATVDYIPALQHIHFEGDVATSYNDVSAITVECNFPIKSLLPADLLARTLASFSTSEVAVSVIEGKNAMLVTSGRSKIKVPMLEADDFPFKPTERVPSGKVSLTPPILAGIEACLVACGNDRTRPAAMGVTIEAEGDKATLYSTDNVTVTRYRTAEKIKLPADTPVILPKFFCEQIVSLSGAFPKAEHPYIGIYDNGLKASFGEHAEVYTKVLMDVEPIDFARIFTRFAVNEADLTDIPPGLDAAVDRANLIVAAESPKTCVLVAKVGTLRVNAASKVGELDDDMEFDGEGAARVDPSTLARGLKTAAKMAFLPKALLLVDDECYHLIAHVQ